MSYNWRKLSFILLAVAAFALAVFLIGCGGGGGQPSSGTTQNPVPSIANISPTYVPAGSSSQTLSINGSGFVASSSVTFNGLAHAATLVSSQQLTITLSQSDLANPGNYPVAVTNPPPGGGTSASTTFSVWNTFTDSNTGMSFSFPVFGSSTYTIEVDTSTPGLAFLDIELQDGSGGEPTTEFVLTKYSNSGSLDLNDWFEQNIDINGILAASNTFQSSVLSDSSTALVFVGPMPAQYLDVGTPLDYAYRISSGGQVVSIVRSNATDLFDRGYSQTGISTLELEILGTVHF
jgi:hypothetical protein